MFKIIYYAFLKLIRNRANLFWILLFPILLGTMFQIAFSNLSDSDHIRIIPVAIVREDTEAARSFCSAADALAEEGENQMLSVTYCTEEEALKLLEAEKITGIFYAGDRICLTVSSNMSNEKINQSILQTFLEQYQLSAAVFANTAASHPEQLPALAEAFSNEPAFRKEISLSYGSSDPYAQYFYNLIAMACLFTAINGIYISIENQGNLSALAARKNISPVHKLTAITGELIANILFEFLLNLLAFFFLILVLKVDLTTRLPMAVLAIFISVTVGVSFGFFIGAVGTKTEEFKTGISFSIIMPCCFLSGLMVGNMRILVEENAPIINRINPAALISDCFYTLSNYESLDRYYLDLATLLLYAALLTFGGFLLTRRKKYASL